MDTLENEVALYRRLAGEAQPLAACVPRLYGYDEKRGVLILKWIADGRDLYRHHAVRDRCSRTLSAALGRVLAVVHAVAPDGMSLRDDAPWVLSLHRPAPAALKYLSAASIELIEVIQADDRFAAAWTSCARTGPSRRSCIAT